jgi:hypothetical protein
MAFLSFQFKNKLVLFLVYGCPAIILATTSLAIYFET